eukprot:jgi/Tetstr1/429446/TSEL_001915.t1
MVGSCLSTTTAKNLPITQTGWWQTDARIRDTKIWMPPCYLRRGSSRLMAGVSPIPLDVPSTVPPRTRRPSPHAADMPPTAQQGCVCSAGARLAVSSCGGAGRWRNPDGHAVCGGRLLQQ